jgi:hypothetical protein
VTATESEYLHGSLQEIRAVDIRRDDVVAARHRMLAWLAGPTRP